MARRAVKKTSKRARKTSGARKTGARKSAAARKKTAARKSSVRRGARKTSARAGSRKQATGRKKTAARPRKATVPRLRPMRAGTEGGGGRDRDELTNPSEDFMAGPDDLDEVETLPDDEDLDR